MIQITAARRVIVSSANTEIADVRLLLLLLLLLLLSRFRADTMATWFRSIVGFIDQATGRFCELAAAGVLARKSSRRRPGGVIRPCDGVRGRGLTG